MKRWLWLLFLIVPLSAEPQEKYRLPLDPPLVVSGTFGELRSSHFHSGVDFSTRKQIGLPVYAIEKGSISRVKVAPDGYGNALYLRLTDGKTAVYAHLDRFSPKIEAAVWRRQLAEKNSFVDFVLEPGTLLVERGEVIAFSGDTGEVPPHLHFELRDKQERPLNPLTEAFNLPDTTQPKILAVHLTDLGGGVVGIEAAINDESSGNRCAPLKVSLFVDGNLQFQRRFDSFSFDEHRFPFAVYNRRLWLDKKGNFERLYIYPRSDFSFQQSPAKTGGGVPMKKGESKRIRIETEDAAGNKGSIDFKLADSDAEKTKKTPDGSGWQKISPKAAQTIRSADGAAALSFAKNSVFAETSARIRVTNNKRFASFPLKSAAYQVEPRDFLVREKPLFSLPLPKTDNVGISLFQWDEERGKWKFVKGQKREGGNIVVPIGSFNTYALLQDSEPPKITNLRRETGSDGEKRLAFNVSDKLSGIDWRAIRIQSGGTTLIYQVNLNRNEVSLKTSQLSGAGDRLQITVPDSTGKGISQEIQLSETLAKQ